jgi:ribosomal protein RSM22 (predicted rRNA methylase)
MVKLGTALGGHAHMPAVRRAEWRQLDLTDSWGCEPADITIAAYVVGELWPVTRPRLLRRLWEHASEVCVVVEPGTPRGFDVVRQAGDDLVTAGALVIAPFPQDWQCLEGENDWCHFAQRVPRTRSHRTAKDAVLSYEDEKYSYVVASRRGGSRIAARVVRQPQIRSGHVRLVLCTPAGVRHLVVARSQREAYRRVKDLAWGSAILPEEASLYGLTT